MSIKQHILKTLTTKELRGYLDNNDEYMLEKIQQEIYNLAVYFIVNKQNTIDNLDFEDYLQELVMEVWSKNNKFNDKKGSFTTWCFHWFSSKKYNLIYNIKNEIKMVSLDIPISGDNSEDLYLLDCIPCDTNLFEKVAFEKIFENCSSMYKLWLEGWSYNELANENNIHRETVKRIIVKETNELREKLWGKENEFSTKI